VINAVVFDVGETLVDETPFPADQIVYVGDRLDNDLRPAKAAGLRTAFIRRGPWGHILANHPDMARTADWHLTMLTELPGLVVRFRSSAR
jgi:FMN phosphatase YigB (HAD superfamily)